MPDLRLYVMAWGRGIDDRIAIIVPSDKADNAKQVIKEMGLEQNVTH